MARAAVLHDGALCLCFEKQLQMARVMAEEPESLAFVRARKTVGRRGGGGIARKK